jgi:hypothetical protein
LDVRIDGVCGGPLFSQYSLIGELFQLYLVSTIALGPVANKSVIALPPFRLVGYLFCAEFFNYSTERRYSYCVFFVVGFGGTGV